MHFKKIYAEWVCCGFHQTSYAYSHVRKFRYIDGGVYFKTCIFGI